MHTPPPSHRLSRRRGNVPRPATSGGLRIYAYADSPVYGGAESFFSTVVRRLALRPHFHIDAGLAPHNDRLRAELSESCPVTEVAAQPIHGAALWLYDPRRRRRARESLRALQPDVVFANLPSAECGATIVSEARKLGVPVVGLLHIHRALRTMGFRAGRIRDALAGRQLDRIDVLVTLFPSAATEAESLWAGTHTRVVTTPMPRPRVGLVAKGVAREILGLPRDSRIVGLAGRISIKQKGLDTFVGAAAILGGSGFEGTFAIAGDGPDREQLSRLIANASRDVDIRHLGRVQPIDLFLSAIDFIAIPSRFEGVPLISLEALEAGVPGVAARVDGLAEVWPEPFQHSPGDAVGLARALRELVLREPASVAETFAHARRSLDSITATAPEDRIAALLEAAAFGDLSRIHGDWRTDA